MDLTMDLTTQCDHYGGWTKGKKSHPIFHEAKDCPKCWETNGLLPSEAGLELLAFLKTFWNYQP